jgi:hypothetical protein
MAQMNMNQPARVTADRLADSVQRPGAARFNLRILGRIARAYYGKVWSDPELPALARHLVERAEAGTLTNGESRIMGAYGVAILRECVHG